MTNDEKILELKEQVNKKRKTVKKVEFKPVTNCLFPGLGLLDKVNINVLNSDNIDIYLLGLLSLEDTAIKHDINIPVIGSYSLSEWKHDFLAKREQLINKKKENELKALEDKLSHLLSTDAKVLLELGDLEKSLQSL